MHMTQWQARDVLSTDVITAPADASVAESDSFLAARRISAVPLVDGVDDGLVTLSGRTDRKSTAQAAVGLTEAVPGVTGVVDRLTFDTDDTVATPAERPSATDPLLGWRIGRRRHQPGPDPVDNHSSL